MQKSVFSALLLVFLVVGAHDANAQIGDPWTDRGYFHLNFGFESATGQLNDATTRLITGEQATLAVSHAIDSGAVFDFSVGARVWENVSVGIGFHRGGTDSEASMTGSIPHPLFPNRPRALALATSDLDRSERALHLQVGYMLPVTNEISVHVTLGPSFFKVSQDVVNDVSLTNTGPTLDTLVASPTIIEREESPVGFNIGADVAYNLYTRDRIKVGAGLFLRYAGASADLQIFENAVDSDLGGLQIGFGVRTRF